MVYKVIGLMSGSSLDGLDIVYTQLDEVRGQWAFEIKHAECIPYTAEWTTNLKQAISLPVADFLRLHTAYGRYLGQQVADFIERHSIDHQVHFIASHGHTVLHDPPQHTTFQLGEGASIAAITGLPVISDLRALDVALGGQGAPIVPIGDRLLFADYDYHLNIGGIANITVPYNGELLAFDLCPANQALNALAAREGKMMDEDGAIAASGKILSDLLDKLDNHDYHHQPAPKSLSNEAAIAMAAAVLDAEHHHTADLLHTMAQCIANQAAAAVRMYPAKENATMLVTGGGAFNKHLVLLIEQAVQPLGITVSVPDASVVTYKEAIVMALIGALRWREETNVLSSVTGASRDSISGTVWMGHSYSS